MSSIYRGCARVCKHWQAVARDHVSVGGDLRVVLSFSSPDPAARIRSFLKVPWLGACRALAIVSLYSQYVALAGGLASKLGDRLYELYIKCDGATDSLHWASTESVVHSVALNCGNLVALTISCLISANSLRHLLLQLPALRTLCIPNNAKARNTSLGMELCTHGTALINLKCPVWCLAGLRASPKLGMQSVMCLSLDCTRAEKTNILTLLQHCQFAPKTLQYLRLTCCILGEGQLASLAKVYPRTRLALRDCVLSTLSHPVSMVIMEQIKH